MINTTCKVCQYWHRARPVGDALPNLAAPPVGECRRRLHPLIGLDTSLLGGIGGGMIVLQPVGAFYPVIPATMPACGDYEAAGGAPFSDILGTTRGDA